jgi:hypothetical protein
LNHSLNFYSCVCLGRSVRTDRQSELQAADVWQGEDYTQTDPPWLTTVYYLLLKYCPVETQPSRTDETCVSEFRTGPFTVLILEENPHTMLTTYSAIAQV